MKTAAILTIYKADKMTVKGRKQIAVWLRRQADDLIKLGDEYGKKLICRYHYLSKKPKKIAIVSYH